MASEWSDKWDSSIHAYYIKWRIIAIISSKRIYSHIIIYSSIALMMSHLIHLVWNALWTIWTVFFNKGNYFHAKWMNWLKYQTFPFNIDTDVNLKSAWKEIRQMNKILTAISWTVLIFWFDETLGITRTYSSIHFMKKSFSILTI